MSAPTSRRRGALQPGRDPYRLGGDPYAGAPPRRGTHPSRKPSRLLDPSDPRESERILTVRREIWHRANAAALDRIAASGWEPPPRGRSLAEARLSPPQAPRQVVDGVMPYGLVLLSGQFKAGTTTFAINLAEALGSGADFLGAYPVDFPEGNISYWNNEVDEPLFYSWMDARVKDEDAARRIVPHHLRGYRIRLTNRKTAEWAIRTLAEDQAQAWIIDPIAPMLDSENDNSEFSRWLEEAMRVARIAGVSFTFVRAHSPHGAPGQEDAIPRARGASGQMGGSDANLAYRHGGKLGEYPTGTRRYLSGFGRGVDLTGKDEVTLEYEAGSNRLYAVRDAPGRAADQEAQLADLAVTALSLSGAPRLNSTQLQAAIGGNGARRPKAIAAALSGGRITSSKEGRNVWYALPLPGSKPRISGPKTARRERSR